MEGALGRWVRACADQVAPPRLGPQFRLLLGQSWLNSLGGGMALAAGPLLIASQTSDPRLISLAALLDWLPGFVFGMYAGVLADRHDRRALMMYGNVLRVLIVGALVVILATGSVSVPLVLVVMLALGISDTFAYSAGRTVLPMIVPRTELGIANARFQFGFQGINRLIAPPIGAALFTVGMAWPFLVQVLCAALAAVLLSRLRLPPHGVAREDRRHVLAEIREGWHWSWRIPAVRALNLQIVTFNVAYGAVFGTMVLYARERLGLSSVGYGLLISSVAVGGVIGAITYGWLERRFQIRDIMRYGLVWEVSTWGILAWTTHWWIALPVLTAFGVHEGYWAAISGAVQQRAVPQEVQGRVGSIYLMLLMGGLVAGAGLSGVLSRTWGVTAPYWFGCAIAGVVLVVLWRELGRIAHADAVAAEVASLPGDSVDAC